MDLISMRPVISRLGFGLAALLFGVTKFVWPGFWADYTAAWFLDIVPLSGVVFMYIVGVIETAVGVSLLTGLWSRTFAGIASLWLLLVTVNLLIAGYYDIALRDLGLALLAYGVWVDQARADAQAGAGVDRGAAAGTH